MAAPPPPLLELLSNEYLLLATTPYLLPHELYALSRTSRSFHSLLTHSRSVYRHLHRPPLRMLSLAPIIRDVKTLVLDGAAVTVDDLHRLLAAPYRIALLSLRACNAINQRQLMLLLQYLFRPDRAPDATSLRGIYLFGAPSDEGNPGNIVTQPGWTWRAECAWDPAWASTLRACEGACVFDAALCGGCDGAAVALVRLAGGCAGCGGGGGGAAETGEGGKGIVLVPPVPLTSSDVRVACRGGATGTVMRCGECLERRHCSLCRTWWCASCVADSAGGGKPPCVSVDCYECGPVCAACADSTARVCRGCRGGYCLQHNDGSDDLQCEWCNASERRTREFSRNTVNAAHAHALTGQLDAIRATVASRHFRDEVIVRNRCLMTS